MGMPIGMCIGICLGMVLGKVLLNNIGVGLCLGLSIGMSLGMTLDYSKKQSVNREIQKNGLKIKEIREETYGDFSVVVEDKNGERKTVNVSHEDMEEQKFSIGDTVLENEDGSLYQAFDKGSKK